MKKTFAILAALALVFASCKLPLENNDDSGETPKLPSLTIKNESSYDLKDVTFSGVTFATDGKVLKKSTNSAKAFNAKASGYITFVRNDIGIACRTVDVVTIDSDDKNFIFLDSTIVEEVANTANRKTLGQITFVSKVTIERGGLSVAKNEVLNLGEALANNLDRAFDFTLKNTNPNSLELTGSEPVKVSGGDASSFTVVQPAQSKIEPNSSLTFTINFKTTEEKDHTATVTIKSNDVDGDFSFEIRVKGVPPKPIASIYFGQSEIAQDGVIDAGEALINSPAEITVKIKNTGSADLTIETANITISGTNGTAFTKTTSPGSTIKPDKDTSFIITFKSLTVGEHNATLTIPTNDDSRSPVTVSLKVTARKLTKPAKPTVYAGNQSLKVTWEKVDAADSYNVYYGTSATPLGSADFSSLTETSVVIRELTNGYDYYVWVQAVKGASLSDLSDYTRETAAYIYTVNTAATFAKAVANIDNMEDREYTINVIGNFGASEVRFTGGGAKTVIIKGDTARHTVSNDGSTALFVVPSGITLELGNNLTLSGANKEASLVEVQTSGIFTMQDGSILTQAAKTAVTSSGSFTMKGGSITNNNSTSNGGGVVINGGTFTMEGGTISSNTAAGNGGGVYVGGGHFTKTGGTIDDSNKAVNGKAVYTSNGYYRNATAGPTHNMDSTTAETAGGWGDPPTRLTIKNESAYDLADVKWQDNVFKDIDGSTLVKTNDTVTMEVAGGSAYLYFTRKTPQFKARSKNLVLVTQYEDTEFTIEDSTLVVEAANVTNNGAFKDLQTTTEFTAASTTDFTTAITSINGLGVGEYTITVNGTFDITAIRFTGTAVKTVIIEGAGTDPTLKNSGTNELFVVRNGLTLQLDNITLDGNSKAARVIKVENGGTLIMNSGATVKGAATYGIHSEGTFTMNAGTVSDNTNSLTTSSTGAISNYCGGVLVAGGVFTMKGGDITHNSVSATTNSSSSPPSSYGGGVYVSGGTFIMSGGSITSNTASSSTPSSYVISSSYGGGVCVNGGTFTMSGGSITSNTAASSSYSSYYSYSYGGGVYVNNGEFTKTGGSIDNTNILTGYYQYGTAAYAVGGNRSYYRDTTAGNSVNMGTSGLSINNYTQKGWTNYYTN